MHDGEIVGLIGANGAGKTTTVECIHGLRIPDAGEFRVLGYDPVTQGSLVRPLIGSQLEDSALPDRLRVGEAVELFATARAQAKDQHLVWDAVSRRHRAESRLFEESVVTSTPADPVASDVLFDVARVADRAPAF